MTRARRRMWTVLVTLAAVAVAGCGEAEKPLPAAELRIATGNDGGVYSAYGRGLARIVDARLPRLDASALRTDGSVQNLRLLASRRADVAFTLADSAADALRGAGPFARRIDIVALARLYDNYVQLIVRHSASAIRSVEDLAGKVVSVGAPGSGTALIANRVLGLAEPRGAGAPRRVRLGVDGSAAALAAGRIDAFFWSGGLPTPAIDDLTQDVAIRLIDLGGVAARLRRRHGDLYTETRIPVSAYGPRGAVRTVSVANFLAVRRDFDERTAYRLTRMLFERHDELKRVHPEAARLQTRAAIVTYPLDLHPGAEQYYGEAR